jgi:acyl-CoA thioester hydrolase
MVTSFVRWSDLDGNNHMANTAFLDVCVDVRLSFFEAQEFPRSELARLGFGPVVRRDEVDYLRELRLGQKYQVDFELAGCSEDGSRFILRNTFWLEDGTKVAVVTSHGGWLDLQARRLVAPPEGLLAALRALPRTTDFAELPSSLSPR